MERSLTTARVHHRCTIFTLSVQKLYIHSHTLMRCCMYTHCSSASLNLWHQQQQQHFPSENLWQAVPLLLILSLRQRMYHCCELTLNLNYLQLPTPAGIRRCRSLSHTAHLDIEMWTRLRNNTSEFPKVKVNQKVNQKQEGLSIRIREWQNRLGSSLSLRHWPTDRHSTALCVSWQ